MTLPRPLPSPSPQSPTREPPLGAVMEPTLPTQTPPTSLPSISRSSDMKTGDADGRPMHTGQTYSAGIDRACQVPSDPARPCLRAGKGKSDETLRRCTYWEWGDG